MIKLVVSDMDGTLIHRSKLSERNLEAIHKLHQNQIEFAIASGRDYNGVYSIIHDHDLQCEAILGNGAEYVNQDGELLISCYMDKSIIKKVIATIEPFHLPYMIFTNRGFYTGCDPEFVKNQFIERGIRRFHDSPDDFKPGGRLGNAPCTKLIKIDDFDTFLNEDLEIIKVEVFSLDNTIIPSVKEKLKDISHISYLSSFDDNVEITNEFAQKGLILKQVAKMKHLKNDEIAVVGDGMNDITMFQHFKYSFATNNGEDEIKQLAYQIVADCKDDGFSEAIDTILHMNKI